MPDYFQISNSEIESRQKALTDLIASGGQIGSTQYTTEGDSQLQQILLGWSNSVIAQMRNNLARQKAVASGNLLQSIAPDVKTLRTGGNVKIMMLDYWEWVDQGRPATKSNTKGSPTLQQSLEEWIRMKGIQVRTSPNQNYQKAVKSLAYVIARKIHREGFKERPFVTPVINDRNLAQLGEAVGRYISIAVLPK